MEVGDKEKRESVSLNASMTDDVGFDAARDDNVTFDAKPDRMPKKVKFVSEEESDGGDLFENMKIVDANDEDGEKDDAQFSMNINALNDVLSACQNAVTKEEEREKDEEDTTESKSIGATWAKIKKEVSNEGSHKKEKEKEKKNQHRDRKKSKNNKKKSKNQKNKRNEKRHNKNEKKQKKTEVESKEKKKSTDEIREKVASESEKV